MVEIVSGPISFLTRACRAGSRPLTAVDAERQRWGVAPRAARSSQRWPWNSALFSSRRYSRCLRVCCRAHPTGSISPVSWTVTRNTPSAAATASLACRRGDRAPASSLVERRRHWSSGALEPSTTRDRRRASACLYPSSGSSRVSTRPVLVERSTVHPRIGARDVRWPEALRPTLG